MSAGFVVRIYELFNRPHGTVINELWHGDYGYSFLDVSPAMEIVFETETDWTMFRVAFDYHGKASQFGPERFPSLITSVSRNLVEAVINQLSMSETAVVIERIRLEFRDGRDHDRLQAALDAAVAPAWSARSFSI